MSKLPDHLQPMYNELAVEFKDGRFQNETGTASFKTAQEAVEHNAQMEKLVAGFAFKPTHTKPFRKRVTAKPAQKTTPIDFDLNLFDELNSIRKGLEDLKQLRNPVETKKSTSSGLNYLMGVPDEQE